MSGISRKRASGNIGEARPNRITHAKNTQMYIKSILFFGSFKLLFYALLNRAGFFRLPAIVGKSPLVSFKMIAVTFAIYLRITSLIAPACGWLIGVVFIFKWFKIAPLPITPLAMMQIGFLMSYFRPIYLYSRSQDPRLFKEIWKSYGVSTSSKDSHRYPEWGY